MGSDPYGFPETATPAGGSPTDAIIALWTGVGALACGAIGPCFCYVPWLVAIPLAVAAVWFGIRARSGPVGRDAGLEHAANAGIVSGAIGAALGLTFLLGVVAYVAFIVFAVASEL